MALAHVLFHNSDREPIRPVSDELFLGFGLEQRIPGGISKEGKKFSLRSM